MRRRKNDESQTSLDNLMYLLEEEPGKLHKLPIDPNDIGGELLAVLTKGLYTNPMDCIREYVQNAVDAGARSVKIKITGNSVMIFDDGNGMNLDDLLQARQFGLSYKFVAQHVGFRGIGIYSGFDLCRRLRITTTKAGDPHLHVLVFDFVDMKNQLETERTEATSGQKTSLIQLLSNHTYIKREPSSFSPERGFTQVELQEINELHIRQLSNRPELKQYLLQNLPIDFADSFKHKDTVNQKLLNHVPGYNPLKITLESDGLEDETVDKYADVDVQSPMFGYVLHPVTKAQIAYYWACLNVKGERVDADVPPYERPKYEGFVYKVKGFTIGDRNKLRDMFANRLQLYPWYTGEVYVLDPNIVPNAERDDFEASQAKQALELGLQTKSKEELVPAALEFQMQNRANDILEKYQEEMVNISDQLAGNERAAKAKRYGNDLEIYAQLDKIVEDLRKHKRNVSHDKRQQADELFENAKRVQKQLVKDVGNATPQTARQKREARKEHRTEEHPLLVTIPPTLPVPPKTLPLILAEAGWTLDGEVQTLATLIQSSLEDVLTMGAHTYRALLDDIEAKLSSNGIDE